MIEQYKKPTVEELQQQFTKVHQESLGVGRELAESIDMMSVGEVRETIAKSVVEMESLVNRESSFLEKLPWAGKYLAKARDSAKTESAATGKMVEVVDRLFSTLKAKNDTVMNVMERIYQMRAHMLQYVDVLQKQEAALEKFLEDEGDTFEAQKARNLLVQVKPSIVKARDRLAVMTGTLNSASQASETISSMLPSLQGELQTELAIKASMNELREYKQLFDATIESVEELNYANNKQIQETVLEVGSMSISNPTNLARLAKNQEERQEMHRKLHANTVAAKEAQLKALDQLDQIQSKQTLSLSYMKED